MTVDLVRQFLSLSSLLLLVVQIEQCLPLVTNRWNYAPLAFIVIALGILLIFSLLLAFLISDAEAVPPQLLSQNVDIPHLSGSMRFHVFLHVNLTAAVIYTTALMCMVVWLTYHVMRTYALYVLPMLNDLLIIEEDIWGEEFRDWGNCTLPSLEEPLCKTACHLPPPSPS